MRCAGQSGGSFPHPAMAPAGRPARSAGLVNRLTCSSPRACSLPARAPRARGNPPRPFSPLNCSAGAAPAAPHPRGVSPTPARGGTCLAVLHRGRAPPGPILA